MLTPRLCRAKLISRESFSHNERKDVKELYSFKARIYRKIPDYPQEGACPIDESNQYWRNKEHETDEEVGETPESYYSDRELEPSLELIQEIDSAKGEGNFHYREIPLSGEVPEKNWKLFPKGGWLKSEKHPATIISAADNTSHRGPDD